MVALKLENINKSYNNTEIIKNLNLEIKKGEVFAIIGLNGAGKTTLIKSIFNLSKAEGSIAIFGKTFNNTTKEDIIFLPEKFTPNKNLKVSDFLTIFVKMYNKNFTYNTFVDYAKLLDFKEEYWNYKIGNLSKGTLQKVGLIAVFCSKSKLIIMDEPLSGLDVKARDKVLHIIKILKEEGKTIVFTSHVVSEMLTVADRIGVFHNKTFEEVITPSSSNNPALHIQNIFNS